MKKPTHQQQFQTVILTIVVMLLAGCATQRRLSPSEQVTIGFQEILPEASTNFCDSVQSDYLVLEESIDNGVNGMRPSLDELVESFDGYFHRVRNSGGDGAVGNETALKEVGSDQQKIRQWLNIEFARFLIPAINQFYVSYTNDVGDLESRLLVRTQISDWVLKSKQEMIAQATNNITTPNPADLKGGVALKIGSDAAGFIPVAGDAYDLFSAFIYDPRMSNIKNQANKYLPDIRTQLHKKFLQKLHQQLAHPEEIQAECKRQFSAEKALEMLAKERQ